jgi:hypothetical protein
MELKDILDKIKAKWAASNRFETIIALENAPKGATTGTEGLFLICKFCRDLKWLNEDAYLEVEDLINELDDYEDRAIKPYSRGNGED